MKIVRWKPNKRQDIAWEILNDKTTQELLYGGGAGGGKSHLGCVWLIYCCIKYPSSRWLMGRAVLKSLKESTLLTFFRILGEWKEALESEGITYRYNSIEGTIKFSNGSSVYLKDLYFYPADPQFDNLGSTEFTGAFVDECSQITEKAFMILKSRIRYKLDEFDLIPKILLATNPTKIPYLYEGFYRASKEGRLDKHKAFIPALVGDNPFMPDVYAENLQHLDPVSRERLLHGNWEYADDPGSLFHYDKIMDMFGIEIQRHAKNKQYLSVDVARWGADSTVIMLWTDMMVDAIRVYPKTSMVDVANYVENIAKFHHIPPSQIIVDDDGVGGGAVDILREMKGMNVKAFVGGSRPIESKQGLKIHNFRNLRSQCYFRLSEYVNQDKVGIFKEIEINFKNKLVEDLEHIKAKDLDKDTKIGILTKEEIKQNIKGGRSPDYGDALMMRMYFELDITTTKSPFIR